MTKKGKRGIPLKYIIKFSALNALSHKWVSAAVALLLAFIMSLLLTASCMSVFSRAKSIAGNLKEQKIYSVIVTDYIQKMYSNSPGIEAPLSWWFTEEMTQELMTKYPELHFGRHYSFGRTLYDFSDAKQLENGFFHTVSFTDFVVIDDFDFFSYELDTGSLPKNEGEVVIFDYMADNMIGFGIFDDVKERKDLVGYRLEDKTSGFSMTVSGILRM